MQNVIDIVQENLKSIQGWCSLEKNLIKLLNYYCNYN